jgi:hypothetical protein
MKVSRTLGVAVVAAVAALAANIAIGQVAADPTTAVQVPGALLGIGGLNPVCVNVSDAVLANVDRIMGLVALAMAALKPISWFLGVTGGKIEDSSESQLIKGIGKLTSYVAWAIGLFNVGNIPASVRYQPKLSLLPKTK